MKEFYNILIGTPGIGLVLFMVSIGIDRIKEMGEKGD